jgi:TIR domain
MTATNTNADEKIERLKTFKNKLLQHQKTKDASLREWLNENLQWARREVVEAGCSVTVTISPPPVTGGLIMRDLDPFNSMFDAPYLRSLVPTICDMIDRTIGVLRNPIRVVPTGPLYNLFVSGFATAWMGEPFQIELSRCVREYTDPNLPDRYGSLDANSISELKRAPCFFAYETGNQLPPKFGYIKEIVHRQGQVRIQYQLHRVEPFLTADDLERMTFELNIGKFELYRTHWAVKEVNLPKELHARGITLPSSVRDIANPVDISRHVFDVALSFPGEVRPLVEQIARELERRLGPNVYFYDNNYVSQLAQPSLDPLLQGLYGRAKLDVVFLSADYQKKDWCGVEFRAVREIISARENSRVMFIRTDDGLVEGVFRTDGFVDARQFEPAKIAEFICERLNLLPQRDAAS